MMKRAKLTLALATALLLTGCVTTAPVIEETETTPPFTAAQEVESFEDITTLDEGVQWALTMPTDKMDPDKASNEILNTAGKLTTLIEEDPAFSKKVATDLKTVLLKVRLATLKDTPLSEQRLMLYNAATQIQQARS